MQKISLLTPNIGMTYSGMGPDSRVLVRRCCLLHWLFLHQTWRSCLMCSLCSCCARLDASPSKQCFTCLNQSSPPLLLTHPCPGAQGTQERAGVLPAVP